jgi:hypothetical protein
MPCRRQICQSTKTRCSSAGSGPSCASAWGHFSSASGVPHASASAAAAAAPLTPSSSSTIRAVDSGTSPCIATSRHTPSPSRSMRPERSSRVAARTCAISAQRSHLRVGIFSRSRATSCTAVTNGIRYIAVAFTYAEHAAAAAAESPLPLPRKRPCQRPGVAASLFGALSTHTGGPDADKPTFSFDF